MHVSVNKNNLCDMLSTSSSGTSQPLKKKSLHSFEMSGYVKLQLSQCNISEDENVVLNTVET